MSIPKNMTLQELLQWRFTESADEIAHKFKDRETSYKELNIASNKIANGLIKQDCAPDSRIAYLGKNSDYFFEFLAGTIKSGTVAVGVNWRLAPPEVKYVLEDSSSEIIFVGKEFYPIVEQIIDELPDIKKVIAVDGEHETFEDFVSWRDKQEETEISIKTSDTDDILQLYTSGTTG